MKKRIFLVLACIWFFVSFFIIKQTYAKYITAITGSTNVGISLWDISINNQNIINQSDFSRNLTLEFPGDTYYIENVAVPGAVGYFDINIDSSNVSLAFDYTVTASVNENSDVTDLKVIGYSFDGGINTTYLNNSSEAITSSVATNINYSSIRVYVQWDDTTTGVTAMNDIADTLAAVGNGNAIMDVNILFEQTSNYIQVTS